MKNVSDIRKNIWATCDNDTQNEDGDLKYIVQSKIAEQIVSPIWDVCVSHIFVSINNSLRSVNR